MKVETEKRPAVIGVKDKCEALTGARDVGIMIEGGGVACVARMNTQEAMQLMATLGAAIVQHEAIKAQEAARARQSVLA